MSTFEDINLFFAFMEVEGKDKSLFWERWAGVVVVVIKYNTLLTIK